MKKFISILVLLWSSNLLAEPAYWVNIPRHHSIIDGKIIPSVSWYTRSHEECSDAVVDYARDNLVNFISCSTRPLPDASNLSDRVKMKYFGQRIVR